jgi:hypothetical protein
MAEDFSHVVPVEEHVAECLICRSVVARQLTPRALPAEAARSRMCAIGRAIVQKAVLLGGLIHVTDLPQ